jgi:hypothetical protein
VGLLALAVAGVAGCARSADGSAATTAAAPTTTASAAPRTTAARPAPKPKPKPTPKPVTVDAPCPYADRGTMAGTVGQRISRTTVTRTRPHVGCAFYRSSGEKAVDIAVSVLASPAAAQARAVAVAGAGANPVDRVGDGGAVRITDTGAVLGVSKGRALVVVRINQRISLEAVEIARLVVAKL